MEADAALRIGNHWQVDSADTLGLTIPVGERPSIIVSNPPWRFNRDAAAAQRRQISFFRGCSIIWQTADS